MGVATGIKAIIINLTILECKFYKIKKYLEGEANNKSNHIGM